MLDKIYIQGYWEPKDSKQARCKDESLRLVEGGFPLIRARKFLQITCFCKRTFEAILQRGKKHKEKKRKEYFRNFQVHDVTNGENIRKSFHLQRRKNFQVFSFGQRAFQIRFKGRRIRDHSSRQYLKISYDMKILIILHQINTFDCGAIRKSVNISL